MRFVLWNISDLNQILDLLYLYLTEKEFRYMWKVIIIFLVQIGSISIPQVPFHKKIGRLHYLPTLKR